MLKHNTVKLDHVEIRKAILKSQHCQRNFDLSQNFPEGDIELLKTAVSQCPSKQNIAFYKPHFIFDRDIIERIHEETRGFTVKTLEGQIINQTNSQVLANLVVVFEDIKYERNEGNFRKNDRYRYTNNQLERVAKGTASPEDLRILERDKKLAVGIAAGYLNLTASLLGYSTGCCSCFNEGHIMKILGLKQQAILMMGIGFFQKQKRASF